MIGFKNSKIILENSQINIEIIDSIEKMQSINLFAKDILSEDQEYKLLQAAKSNDTKISRKAANKLADIFQNSHLNTQK